MTTPSDELRTAAATLRRLTEALPANDWGDRPWRAEECSDTDDMSPCPCIVAQGEYREFDQPQIPPIQYVADAETPEFAAYIAAMGPNVGAALADWLEFHAAMDERLLALVDGAPGMDEATWGGKPHPALAVARAINGGQP